MIRRCFVMQALQHNGGGDKNFRWGRCRRQLGPPRAQNELSNEIEILLEEFFSAKANAG